jgi:hypothetical protein
MSGHTAILALVKPDSLEAPSPSNLVETWRSQANELRRIADAECAARAFENAATQLELALRQLDDQLLTVQQAAGLVNRHRDTVGAAIKNGRLPNHGAKHRPRVRRGELVALFPPKSIAQPEDAPYDPIADARSLLGTRRGGKS